MTAAGAAIAVAVLSALAGGMIGRMKGSSFLLWFFIAGFFPLAGLLAAVFYRWEDRELRRQCPGCDRVVKLHDAVCMACGEELEYPSVAIASESAMRKHPVSLS